VKNSRTLTRIEARPAGQREHLGERLDQRGDQEVAEELHGGGHRRILAHDHQLRAERRKNISMLLDDIARPGGDDGELTGLRRLRPAEHRRGDEGLTGGRVLARQALREGDADRREGKVRAAAR
jgi:hypothetical protein